ncbi:Uncharacterised protein [Suttonella ornithocola]|uniref:Uncharacterized protein n=1 Tax=Suttonella ornithocola TaxID=279832 RepID=A0A380MWR1_9GAMM|nr:Uncharacterised protein [Suttonella ornithocola]
MVTELFRRLAKFVESNLIIERTQVGLQVAQARGKNVGCPKRLNPQHIKEIKILMYSLGISTADISKHYGVSRDTFTNFRNDKLI